MGATNHTTNYNLSQFIGSDKPAWLQDYNGDMSLIDAGINAAKTVADGAKAKSDNNETILNSTYKFKGAHVIDVTGDGVKTYGQILNELVGALNAYVATKDSHFRFTVNVVTPDTSSVWPCVCTNENGSMFDNSGVSSRLFCSGSSVAAILQANVSTTLSDCGCFHYGLSTNTLTDMTSNVLANGNTGRIVISEYEL